MATLKQNAEKWGDESAMLKTEPTSQGLYASHNSARGYTSYLRFYADGTVMGVTYTGTAQDLATTLVPGPPRQGYSVGKCEPDGNNLSFVMTSEAGKVDYAGTVSADGSTLHLNSLSHINGHRATWDFVYVSVTVEATHRVADLFSADSHGSKGRFSVAGKVTGSLSIGPHVAFVGDDAWPLINVRMSDGSQTVIVDFPISLADALIAEMQRIVAEYGDGNHLPRTWDTPWS